MKICMDAGHYGQVNAGIVTGYYESEMTLKLANYLKTEMEAFGAEVYMTRTDTSDLSLTARGTVAVDNDCDMFISLHSDASSSASSRGVIAFRSLSHPDSLTLGKQLVAAVCSVMDAPASTAYNATEGCGYREGSAGDGSDYYTVINAARKGCDHVYLLEHSFHTNLIDCTFLGSDENLSKIAEAEAAVIAAYFGLTAELEPFSTDAVQLRIEDYGDNFVPVCMAIGNLGIACDTTNLADGYFTTGFASSGDQVTIRATCAECGATCAAYFAPASDEPIRMAIGWSTHDVLADIWATLNDIGASGDQTVLDGWVVTDNVYPSRQQVLMEKIATDWGSEWFIYAEEPAENVPDVEAEPAPAEPDETVPKIEAVEPGPENEEELAEPEEPKENGNIILDDLFDEEDEPAEETETTSFIDRILKAVFDWLSKYFNK